MRWALIWGALLLGITSTIVWAAEPEEHEVESTAIHFQENPSWEGKVLRRVEIESTDPLWDIARPPLPLRAGDPFSSGLARRAAHRLLDTGFAAEITIRVTQEGEGIALLFAVLPQRLVRSVRVQSPIAVEDVLRSAGVDNGRTITPSMLRTAQQKLSARASSRGYPDAQIRVDLRSTDNPLAIIVLVELALGEPRRIHGIRTEVHAPNMASEVRELLKTYPVRAGDLFNEEHLTEQDKILEKKLQISKFYQAQVTHRAYQIGTASYLLLEVHPGPLFRLRFEGNTQMDAEQLSELLNLEHESERSIARAVQKIREEYQRVGFLDAEVSGQELGDSNAPLHELFFTIRENPRTRVIARHYPCYLPNGGRTTKDLNKEIDSFLEEELPGATLLGVASPSLLDQSLGPTGTTGARPTPIPLDPQKVYVLDVYERASKHLRDLYRSEGYLAVVVGPVQVLRNRCSPSSPPHQCIPIPTTPPPDPCYVDPLGVPLEEPAISQEFTCKPDPKKNIVCAPELEVRIPLKPGPRAIIHDIVFEHAESFPETQLLQISKLNPGEWASNIKIEESRRALQDFYREEGFAYANISTTIELSPNKKLARVRYTIEEHEKVHVDRILIKGNLHTRDSLILSRLRMNPGDLYRQSTARRSEEQLATLGIFSTVSVGLEDPTVPAPKKNVLITVVERLPQYMEMRPGLSTGEGIRGTLEYGHRNLGGLAIQFTFRVQISYLPDAFIPDNRIRENFQKLSLGERMERRNSASFQFPNIFHPTIRLGLDAVDARSNSRDFGLTKDAILPSLTWSYSRQLSTTFGLSFELNNVDIFSGDSIQKYLQQPGVTNDLSRLLRVPDGETTAIGQRISTSWDRRDNPLGASQGTLLTGSIEHVRAFPAVDNPNTITSDFLRFNGRAGIYFRLSNQGITLATMLGAGYNFQLIKDSKTYPDRLFFLGGVDNIRGFLRDALIPQDIADKIIEDRAKNVSDPSRLTIDKVAIRGGDVFINPRIELRIPLSGPLETALFLDTGNLWVEPEQFDPFLLRYTGGSGIRLATPVGPVAIDYGLNLRRRFWEDRGAFHFSIGLF